MSESDSRTVNYTTVIMKGVPQYKMSAKEYIIIAFIFLLWFYSILLIYRSGSDKLTMTFLWK